MEPPFGPPAWCAVWTKELQVTVAAAATQAVHDAFKAVWAERQTAIAEGGSGFCVPNRSENCSFSSCPSAGPRSGDSSEAPVLPRADSGCSAGRRPSLSSADSGSVTCLRTALARTDSSSSAGPKPAVSFRSAVTKTNSDSFIEVRQAMTNVNSDPSMVSPAAMVSSSDSSTGTASQAIASKAGSPAIEEPVRSWHTPPPGDASATPARPARLQLLTEVHRARVRKRTTGALSRQSTGALLRQNTGVSQQSSSDAAPFHDIHPEQQERATGERATGGEFGRQVSGFSCHGSSPINLYSKNRPTVQSLQSDVAAAVLENSVLYRALQRRPHRARTGTEGFKSEESNASPIMSSGSAWSGPSNTSDKHGERQARPLPNEVEKAAPLSSSSGVVESNSGSRRRSMSGNFTSVSSQRITSSKILQARIDELAQEAMQTQTRDLTGDLEELPIPTQAVPLALRIVGLLPWDVDLFPRRSAVYQMAVRAVVLVAVVAFALMAAPRPVWLVRSGMAMGCEDESTMCWHQHGFYSQVVLPVGALLSLMPFGLRRHQKLLEETFNLVRGVSVERGYGDWDMSHSRRDAAVFMGLWVGAIAATTLNRRLAWGQSPVEIVPHAIFVAIFIAIVLCLAYSIVCISRSLIVMVDAFCCDIVGSTQLEEIAHFWNLTQAVLRKASTDVEKCLLILCLILAISVPLLTVDVAILGASGEDMPSLLPEAIVTCCILYALLLASMVSEKCTRVPALVNAISFGEGSDRARQHTVDYIASSAAGFYVFDTRLTSAMVVKTIYVLCIVVVGVLTRIASTDS